MSFQWVDPFEPDDYQNEGVDFFIKYGRMLCALPVGSGKSCIPLKASRSMDVKSITIICSGNALYTWVRQVTLWRPDLAQAMVVVEHMNKAQRKAVWDQPLWKVVIITAKTFQRDFDDGLIHNVPTLAIGDECQKFMRRNGSKTSDAVITYFSATKYAAFLTGTGASRGRQEFFPVLRALRPTQFTSYWRFVSQWCYTHRGPFGTEIAGPKDTPKFREVTANTIFRPSTTPKLPPISRSAIPVEMTALQAKLYHALANDMMAIMGSGQILMTPNTLALTTRLRQVLVCPKILDPEIKTYGAGLEAILDHIAEDDGRQHSVVFTPFVDAIPFIQERLRIAGITDHIIFQHGMDSNALKEGEEAFRERPGSIAIVSILFAQSFELETGQGAYFLGHSFNPDDNEQAEGRLRRKTTKLDSVPAYYVQNLGTYDERSLSILDRKTLNTRVDIRDLHGLRWLITGN